MAAINFPTATSDGQTFEADNGVIYTYVGTPPDGYWSGTFQNESYTTLDGRYLKLDASNDPVTGTCQFSAGVNVTGGTFSKVLNDETIDDGQNWTAFVTQKSGTTTKTAGVIKGFAASNLTNGTEVYGFHSAILPGTGRYDIFATGGSLNYFAGYVGIGTASPWNKLTVVGTTQATSANQTQFISSYRVDNVRLNLGGVNDKGAIQVTGTGTASQLLLNPFGGNVGIGTNSPAQLLDLASTAPNIRLTDTVDGYSEIDGNAATIKFNADKGNAKADSAIIFAVDNSEKARILSGGGITFNGDTVQANALNDYEEGLFTPQLESADGNFSAVYTTSTGLYTKVGNLVSVTGRIICSSTNATGNALRVNGLPFNNVNSADERASGSVGVYTGFGNGNGRAPNALLMLQFNNKADLQFYESTTTTANVTGSSCQSTGITLFFSIQYFTGA